MAKIDELFRFLSAQGGSDLHLAAGLPPRICLHGSLTTIPDWPTFDDAFMGGLLREITSPDQWQEYEQGGDLDFAYALAGCARFRCNFLRQENGRGAVFRIIPSKVKSADDLSLPDAIKRLADLQQGLVLVTGPTGSGKSTTLAAIIDRINTNHAKHIVTIEDPVEFVHQNKRSTFSQREVGHDTDTFAGALRGALRQDADVVLVGEMRDLETIALAITAAQMGALVFGTLHTNGAINTIDRLVDAFPAEQQSQVRNTLAESLAAVVSQQLIPTVDGKGRVAAMEVLLRTQGMPNVIREGNTPMLRTIMQGGKKDGMQAMDESLMALLQQKRISAEAAYSKAIDKSRFEALMAEN